MSGETDASVRCAHPTPAGVSASARQRGAALVVKRALDVVAAVVVLVLTLPVLIAVAVAIKLSSPGPVLYRGTRVGRGMRTFTAYKFRSMQADADETLHRRYVSGLLRAAHGGARGAPPTAITGPGEAPADRAPSGRPQFKLVDDPRVTSVGRVIRRTSVDELPQLLNVLRGEMSLVGPRPEIPYALEEYEPWQWRRFEVLPGLTGLWQTSGRSRLSPTDMLRLDVEYARAWSLALDVRILLRTPLALFAGA